jgi:anti-sigma B factor antagonist
MKLRREERDGVVVLSLAGELMGGDDAEMFQSEVEKALSGKVKNVLVDLGGVGWVNSTGLGILIAGHRTVEEAGGKLKLCRASKRIDSILMVTRLNMIFENYENEAQALASF